MRFEMDKTPLHQHQHLHHQQQQQQQQQVVLSQTTAHQHILSAAEGGLAAATGLVGHGGRFSTKNSSGGNSDPAGSNAIDRECRVSLEERELWSKFQELTNEMIVTKNGR